MLDLALEMSERLKSQEENVLNKYGLTKSNYVLATIHREDNTNVKEHLYNIVEALNQTADNEIRVFFPVHPRTLKFFQEYNFLKQDYSSNLVLGEPVPYGDMILLEKNAKVIVTDSGGVQKEAYFFKVPAVIPRDETEWVEIVEAGWNILTGANRKKIVEGIFRLWTQKHFNKWQNFYGDGNASGKISKIINEFVKLV